MVRVHVDILRDAEAFAAASGSGDDAANANTFRPASVQILAVMRDRR
jgi:hypothetical protein